MTETLWQACICQFPHTQYAIVEWTGASGCVLDFGSRGPWFKPHQGLRPWWPWASHLSTAEPINSVYSLNKLVTIKAALHIAPDKDFDKLGIYTLYFCRIWYANFHLGKQELTIGYSWSFYWVSSHKLNLALHFRKNLKFLVTISLNEYSVIHILE